LRGEDKKCLGGVHFLVHKSGSLEKKLDIPPSFLEKVINNVPSSPSLKIM
jgi:hypothetical protein